MNKKTILEILKILSEHIPNPETELLHSNEFELLVATILSAQCTDKRVNMVTPTLFKACPTPEIMADTPLERLMELIASVNYYKTKAGNLKRMAQMLVHDFASQVPRTLKELVQLPGVGQKTANVVMANAFQIPRLAVDTHVHRVANIIGMVHTKKREDTEIELMKKIPKSWWINAHHLLILHGRYTCIARRPKCEECPLTAKCEYFKGLSSPRKRGSQSSQY